jgi:hypothetical protein
VTRVYAYTLVCDVYEWHGCHNAFARARAGMLPDALCEPEAEAAAAGWSTLTMDDGRVLDVCPVCGEHREERQRPHPPLRRVGGDTAWATAESPVATTR